MAILLRVEQAFPDGTRHVVPILYPTGRMVSRTEREQAERLDEFLGVRMPAIVNELRDKKLLASDHLQKWYALGQQLDFVDDEQLVYPADRDSGLVWLAVRQHCPRDLLPRGEEVLSPERLAAQTSVVESQRRLGKKHDHFERCYKLGKYRFSDVDWLTWSDFDTFLESPGLGRDPRILPIMAAYASKLGRRISRTEFRAICRVLREAIPTKQRERDTTQLSEGNLSNLIGNAFREACPEPG